MLHIDNFGKADTYAWFNAVYNVLGNFEPYPISVVSNPTNNNTALELRNAPSSYGFYYEIPNMDVIVTGFRLVDVTSTDATGAQVVVGNINADGTTNSIFTLSIGTSSITYRSDSKFIALPIDGDQPYIDWTINTIDNTVVVYINNYPVLQDSTSVTSNISVGFGTFSIHSAGIPSTLSNHPNMGITISDLYISDKRAGKPIVRDVEHTFTGSTQKGYGADPQDVLGMITPSEYIYGEGSTTASLVRPDTGNINNGVATIYGQQNVPSGNTPVKISVGSITENHVFKDQPSSTAIRFTRQPNITVEVI